jgi:hypothetical protein
MPLQNLAIAPTIVTPTAIHWAHHAHEQATKFPLNCCLRLESGLERESSLRDLQPKIHHNLFLGPLTRVRGCFVFVHCWHTGQVLRSASHFEMHVL